MDQRIDRRHVRMFPWIVLDVEKPALLSGKSGVSPTIRGQWISRPVGGADIGVDRACPTAAPCDGGLVVVRAEQLPLPNKQPSTTLVHDVGVVGVVEGGEERGEEALTPLSVRPHDIVQAVGGGEACRRIRGVHGGEAAKSRVPVRNVEISVKGPGPLMLCGIRPPEAKADTRWPPPSHAEDLPPRRG